MIKDTLVARYITYHHNRSGLSLCDDLCIVNGSYFKLNPEADVKQLCRTVKAIQSLMNIPESEHGIYLHERHLLTEDDED